MRDKDPQAPGPGPRRLPNAPWHTVRVTQEIIDNACRNDSGHCMVADAIIASVPGSKGASADIATLRFSNPDKGLRYIYMTPRRVQEAILAFDLGEKPDPFEFRLRAGQTIRAGGRRGGKPRPPKSPRQQEALKRLHDLQKRDAPPEELEGRFDEEQRIPAQLANDRNYGPGSVPVRSGGQAPPIGALSGGTTGGRIPKNRRRSFGLRSMDRFK